NREMCRNLFVGIARGDQSQDFQFLGCQRFFAAVLSNLGGGLWSHNLAPRINSADVVWQFLMHYSFQEVALRSGFESAENLYVTDVCSQHDNFCTGELDTDRRNRLDTIHLGHLQVHHCDVRAMNTKLLDGFASVRRFGDNHDVRLNSNEPAESFADTWVVVSDENPNLGTTCTHHPIISYSTSVAVMK